MYEINRGVGWDEIVLVEGETRQVVATIRGEATGAALRLVRMANVAEAVGFTDEELELIATAPPEVLKALTQDGRRPCRVSGNTRTSSETKR